MGRSNGQRCQRTRNTLFLLAGFCRRIINIKVKQQDASDTESQYMSRKSHGQRDKNSNVEG
uniref:Uncharacterized protein n=1 Tax=Megaselia scalaris TaxID=36166 RepID=T1GJT8_MEGSC